VITRGTVVEEGGRRGFSTPATVLPQKEEARIGARKRKTEIKEEKSGRVLRGGRKKGSKRGRGKKKTSAGSYFPETDLDCVAQGEKK